MKINFLPIISFISFSSVFSFVLDGTLPQYSYTSFGRISSGDLAEISGIVESKIHPGILYAHNDKGDGPYIYAIDTGNGNALAATFTINKAHNYDWEDIAYGLCDVSNSNGSYCIYIGETGDHSGTGSRKIIYKIMEPSTLTDQTVDLVGQIHYNWDVLDTETLLFDQTNGDMFIVSKVSGGGGTMGKISASAWSLGSTFPITETAKVPIHSTHKGPTGGDLSADGVQLLIKTIENVYLWVVQNHDVLATVTSSPTVLPYREEHHGEAICWDSQGSGYFTVSEGHNPELHYYARA